MPDRLVKILKPNRMPMHGGSGQWPEPGQWREIKGDLIPCENGLHVCTLPQSLGWLGPCIWEIEVGGDRVDHHDKIIVSRARLIRQYDTWNDRTARLFAADCAERVLPLYERDHPGDTRPREAIAVARRYAHGDATNADLDAARDAARDAAWDAAGAAAWDAAWDAARAAAGVAAWAAAWDAAGVAAGVAAQQWQAERLRQYLDGEAS